MIAIIMGKPSKTVFIEEYEVKKYIDKFTGKEVWKVCGTTSRLAKAKSSVVNKGENAITITTYENHEITIKRFSTEAEAVHLKMEIDNAVIDKQGYFMVTDFKDGIVTVTKENKETFVSPLEVDFGLALKELNNKPVSTDTWIGDGLPTPITCVGEGTEEIIS